MWMDMNRWNNFSMLFFIKCITIERPNQSQVECESNIHIFGDRVVFVAFVICELQGNWHFVSYRIPLRPVFELNFWSKLLLSHLEQFDFFSRTPMICTVVSLFFKCMFFLSFIFRHFVTMYFFCSFICPVLSYICSFFPSCFKCLYNCPALIKHMETKTINERVSHLCINGFATLFLFMCRDTRDWLYRGVKDLDNFFFRKQPFEMSSFAFVLLIEISFADSNSIWWLKKNSHGFFQSGLEFGHVSGRPSYY